jgi:hypothetical protein
MKENDQMPNWCHNSMEITGAITEIARFKQTCVRTVFEGEQAQFDFNAVNPMPSVFDRQRAFEARSLEATGFAHGNDWASKHWGTKWNALHFQVIRDEPDRYECVFDTAWSPPIGVWEKLSEMFPALDFALSGHEPLMDFAFRGTIKDGKIELLDVPVIWETIDPKTGETISGTQEEVEAVLGERGGIVRTSAAGTAQT